VLDTGAAMVNFNIATGAVPPGALFYEIECGTQIPVGHPICISGSGVHHITFCKPGNNQNTYIITSISKPIFPKGIHVRIGCSQYITVLGLLDSTATWNSVYPGTSGQYNSYLSCIKNCTNPLYTPAVGAPPYVDYVVCGTPIATACGYVYACDTVRIFNVPELNVLVTPVKPGFCSGGSGILLTAHPSGGMAPYTYIWKDPSDVVVSTDSTCQATQSGDYSLEVRDVLYSATLCPSVQINVPVIVTSPPVVNAGPDQYICASSPTANLAGKVTYAKGGTWTGGSGTFNPSRDSLFTSYTPTAGEITAGSVTLVLTSTGAGGGCTDGTDTIVLYYPPMLTVSVPSQALLCSGTTTALTPVITGGVTPYTYLWSTGETTSSITQGQGNYCLSVSDMIGCNVMACGNITSPSALAIVMGSTPTSTNGGSDGTATANPSGGTTPYAYSWSNGETTQTITGVPYGIYTVSITDANGCSINSSVVVNEPRCAGFTASTTVTDVMCYGSTTGSILANVSGGTTPYTYAWNTLPVQTSATATGLGAGAYQLTVTDATGCLAAANSVVSQPTQVTNIMNHTNVSTVGGTDGTATANTAGGTPGYTYSWSTGATTSSISNLSQGTYYVTITDNNSCSMLDSVAIAQPPCNSLTLGVYFTPVKCTGGSDGSASAVAAFGTAPYTYSWSTGATTQSVSGLAAGSYAVTITDAIKCTEMQSFTVTQPSPLSIALAPTNISCAQVSDGTIELTITGGTFPYAFNWSNGVTVEDQKNLTDGTYSVIVTDANGCTATGSASITRPTPMAFSATKTDVTCNGGSNGSASVSVSGGVGPYTYSWSNGATTSSLSGLVKGSYMLTVTDANGCSNAIAPLVILIDEPLVVSVSSATTSCPVPGSGIAPVTVSVQGGNSGPYSISFDNGTTFGASGVYTTSLPLDSTYSIVAQDGNGCLSAPYTLSINPQVVITGVSFSKCFSSGTIATTVTVSAAGGKGGAYQVSFNNGVSFYPPGVYSQSLPIDSSYTIVVQDSSLCASAAAKIKIPAVFNVSATESVYAGGYNISCNGSADGSINLTVTGGTAPYIYVWSNAATTQNVSGLGAGSYTVTVTDSNGCAQPISVTLTEPAVLSTTVAATTNYNGYPISCNGSTDGSAITSPSGGTSPYTYSWGTGATTQTIGNLGAGSYSVTVTDNNGCQTTGSVTLAAPAAIFATPTVQNVLCNGFATGSVSLAVSGGVTPYSYSWNNGATTQNILNLNAGTYSVMITDNNGCQYSVTAAVTQTAPVIVSSTQSNISCNGLSDGSVNLTITGGTSPYTFSWDNGIIVQNLNNISAGVYAVTVSDVNGCTAKDTVTITEPSVLTADLSSGTKPDGYNVTFYGGSDGNITTTVNGGTSPFSFVWSNGATTQDLGGLTAGSYTLEVTDSHGCKFDAHIILTEPGGLQMPTGFSPNFDGLNDYFVVHGLDAYPNNHLLVFNRWGNEVFSKYYYTNNWGGTNNAGQELPDGTYFVILEINNGQIKLNGYVDIRR